MLFHNFLHVDIIQKEKKNQMYPSNIPSAVDLHAAML